MTQKRNQIHRQIDPSIDLEFCALATRLRRLYFPVALGKEAQGEGAFKSNFFVGMHAGLGFGLTSGRYTCIPFP